MRKESVSEMNQGGDAFAPGERRPEGLSQRMSVVPTMGSNAESERGPAETGLSPRRGARFVPVVLLGTGDLVALALGMRPWHGSGWSHLAYVGLALALLACSGSYRPRLHRSLLQEAGSLVTSVLAPLAIFAVLLHGTPSLGAVVRRVPATAMLVLVVRIGVYAVVRALRRRGHLTEPTIVVGAGHVAVRVAETLLAHPQCGMTPVGFVDRFTSQNLPLPLLADLDRLDQVAREFEVRRVIVAFGAHREPHMIDLLRSCRRAGVELLVVPRFFELGAAPRCKNTENLWGIPLVRVRSADLRSVRYAVNREGGEESTPRVALGLLPSGSDGGEDPGVTRAPSGSVSVVIPAKNEAQNIPWVLQRLPDFVSDVILVDGASTDDTVEVAKSEYPNIRVVQQDRPGKGAALRAGFAAAHGDFIVMLDADGSMDPTELPRYLDPLDNGYEFVKGSRYIAGGGSEDLTLLRRAGNYGLMLCVNTLFASRFSDLCYGFSAFRRDCLPALCLESDGFEIETEMCLRAVKTGLRIAEVPSVEQCRRFGESNLRTFRDGQRVLRKLLHERLTRQPHLADPQKPVPSLTVAEAS